MSGADSAHDFVGRKVRVSPRWRGAAEFSEYAEFVGTVTKVRMGPDVEVWSVVVEWPNGDVRDLMLGRFVVVPRARDFVGRKVARRWDAPQGEKEGRRRFTGVATGLAPGENVVVEWSSGDKGTYAPELLELVDDDFEPRAHKLVGRKVRIRSDLRETSPFDKYAAAVGEIPRETPTFPGTDDGIFVRWTDGETVFYMLDQLEILEIDGSPRQRAPAVLTVDLSGVFAGLEDVRALIRERLRQMHPNGRPRGDSADALRTALRRLHEATYWIDFAQNGGAL